MVFGLQRYNKSSEQQKFLAIILNFFSLDESFSYFSQYYLYTYLSFAKLTFQGVSS